ncbi:hypothetical protein BN77_4197 [Rhizobium mesoamericanum STM3625]|uniref:Uncharacterized protein n=1 Tax=Rhizobium mesoamericanum STM3625 TaxID=1211777 RepID=K0PL43_9HYPH|nr:hypothetical protein BN77_4197 [Rhizobium mesoamericanum STM3625]
MKFVEKMLLRRLAEKAAMENVGELARRSLKVKCRTPEVHGIPHKDRAHSLGDIYPQAILSPLPRPLYSQHGASRTDDR